MARTKETKVEEVKEQAVEAKEEVKVEAPAAAPAEEKKAEPTLAMKKLTALKEFADKAKISGLQYLQINENNLLVNTRLLVKGQTLPLFIVVNNTVYSYIQAHLVTIPEEKQAETLKFINDMNNQYNMLKYSVNPQGNVVLTFSVPAADDKFEPGLIFALVDQVKAHLEENYSALMEKIWAK
ncbi:MAG: YbjN domain-containing protein [Phascolarctobacterium sp.]|nr:YbjN domain-containing protein [Phascolarctobacterium sp.]